VLIRPSADVRGLGWGESIEIARSDLRSDPELSSHLKDIDTVIHLAAAMSGSDFSRFHETVTGTEHLIAAMREAGTRRLVLCSSFSVYDWSRTSGTVDEDLALLEGDDVYLRGGYATAKTWQERLARRAAEEHDWELTIIRPGFIWGRGNECPNGCIGPSAGPMHLVFAAGRQLPFTHVINAADCFACAVENPASIGQTLNLVDGHDLTTWDLKGEEPRRTHQGALRVWLPYWMIWPVILTRFRLSRLVLGPRIKLPFSFMPAGFAQGFRPLRFSTRRLNEVLGWQPPLSLEGALDETFTVAPERER